MLTSSDVFTSGVDCGKCKKVDAPFVNAHEEDSVIEIFPFSTRDEVIVRKETFPWQEHRPWDVCGNGDGICVEPAVRFEVRKGRQLWEICTPRVTQFRSTLTQSIPLVHELLLPFRTPLRTGHGAIHQARV